MPERDQKLFLEDIIEATDKIDEYTGGMDFEGFAEDKKTFDAVVKNLRVIGEDIKDAHPDIDWSRIAGMRDRLIHGYFGTGKEIVWGTSKRLLPELRERTTAILADLEKKANGL